MTIQSLPPFFDMIYTKSDGHLAKDGYLYNDQMFQALNALVNLVNMVVTSNVSGATVTINGLVPPPLTTAQITALLPTALLGTIFFNSTLGKLQFISPLGVVQTITSV